MAIFNGSFKIAFGFGLGVCAVKALQGVSPAFRGVGRPLLKATVKSGLILARNSREKFAEMRETLSDVAAEAAAELEAEPAQAPPGHDLARGKAQSAGVM